MKVDLTCLSKSQLNEVQRLVAAIIGEIDTAYLVCTGLRKEYCRYNGFLYDSGSISTCHLELLLVCQDADCLGLGAAQTLANKLSTDQFSCAISSYKLSYARQLLQDGDQYLGRAMQCGALLHQHNVILPNARGYVSSRELLESTRACWSRWFGNACKFMDCALFCIAEGNYDLAAFMAHQTVEHTCKAMLHGFAQSCPQTHNINYLLKRCACFHPEILRLFAKDCPEDMLLIKKLKQSYIEARYAKRFTIMETTVWELADRACQLQRIAGELYNSRLERLSCR